MSEINLGNQRITFKYRQDAKSSNFNELLYKVTPKGIVNGGNITISQDKNVILNPFSVIVESSSGESMISVKITTIDSINVSSFLTQDNNYIVGQYLWNEVEDNYMDIKCVSKTIAYNSSSIIFGKVEFVDNEPYSIDYTERTLSKLYFMNKNQYSNFLVTTDGDSRNLIVKPGELFIGGNKVIKYNDTVFENVFSGTVVDGITIKVYMSGNGEINYVSSGDVPNSESKVKIPSDSLLLGIVNIPQNATRIFGNYITQVYDFDINVPSSKEITVDNNLNNTSVNPVQNKVINSKINEVDTKVGEVENKVNGVENKVNGVENKVGKANGIATLDSNTRVPLTQLQNITDTKGKANGIASLDADGRIPVRQLPESAVQTVNDIEPVNGNVTLPNGSMATMILKGDVLTITIPN